jgi:hypothetical protein
MPFLAIKFVPADLDAVFLVLIGSVHDFCYSYRW